MSDQRPAECKATCRGQQWTCDKCRMTWDIDDDDPPRCLNDVEIKREVIDGF